MKIALTILLAVIFSLGCARVRVEAPKEPIKVDISMRLDIYQHVQKDIDAIEGIVSGDSKENKSGGGQSLLDYFIPSAYAQENFGHDVEQAALRRKARYAELTSWLMKAVIGENKSGLLEARNFALVNFSLAELISAENKDRMIIYRFISEKNNISLEEAQKIYAARLQKDAPPGAPVEVRNESSGIYEWKTK